MKKNVYICFMSTCDSVYITESLCCTSEINVINQLYFNKILFLKVQSYYL